MRMILHFARKRTRLLGVAGILLLAGASSAAQASEWGGWQYLSMNGNARLFVRYQWNSNMNGHNVQFRCENNNMHDIHCHYTAEAKCANGSWVNLTGGENIFVRAHSSSNNQSWRGKCANAGGVDYVSVGRFWAD